MAHVFISYQHDNADFAENLKNRVERAGFDAWMDSDRLNPGEDWREGIDQGIKTATALIVVMTPEAKLSEYVTYEWAFAWGAGVPVIPIMLKSTPLHPGLEALQYLDFTNRARPWDRLLARLDHIGKQPAATSKQPQQTSTIQLAEDTPPYLKQAVTALDSVSATQREGAIKTLAQSNQPESRKALVAALKHPIRDVREFAVAALGGIRDANAVSALLSILKDDDRSVQRAAIIQLGYTAIQAPYLPCLIC